METRALDELFGEDCVAGWGDKLFMERARLEYRAMREIVNTIEDTRMTLNDLEDDLVQDIYLLSIGKLANGK